MLQGRLATSTQYGDHRAHTIDVAAVVAGVVGLRHDMEARVGDRSVAQRHPSRHVRGQPVRAKGVCGARAAPVAMGWPASSTCDDVEDGEIMAEPIPACEDKQALELVSKQPCLIVHEQEIWWPTLSCQGLDPLGEASDVDCPPQVRLVRVRFDGFLIDSPVAVSDHPVAAFVDQVSRWYELAALNAMSDLCAAHVEPRTQTTPVGRVGKDL